MHTPDILLMDQQDKVEVSDMLLAKGSRSD